MISTVTYYHDTVHGKSFEGNTFAVRTKMNIHGKTFVVAASFNNEMSNLVNDSTENIRG